MENQKFANNNPSFEGFLENLNNLTDEELQSIYGGIGLGVNLGGVDVDVDVDEDGIDANVDVDPDPEEPESSVTSSAN